MLDFFIKHQKTVMIFLQGICGFIAFLTVITKNLARRKKIGIFLLEIGAFFYLWAPYIFMTYNGLPGNLSWWMVRLAKFFDYFSSLFIIFAMNIYLKDLLSNECDSKKIPLLLILTDFTLLTGVTILIVSQFTNFYYSFDSSNNYLRGQGRFVATIIPAVIVGLQVSCIIPNYKKIAKNIRFPILLFLITPVMTSVLQLFMQGLYFTNISIVGMAIILYVFVIQELNESIEKAHRREVELLENYQKELEDTVEKRTFELRIANEKADRLLLNILPESIAGELKENPGKTISQNYPNATILFTDIVGFTKMSSDMNANQTVALLNNLVSLFDERAEREGIEKIKTIGDAYMAATGLSEEKENNGAEKMIHFARGLLEDVETLNKNSEIKIQIRIGINSGNLVAGVIGKTKFIYDVWGDTVNVASRMESTGEPMKIHVSEGTYFQTKNIFDYTGPFKIEVKGKGTMEAYFII